MERAVGQGAEALPDAEAGTALAQNLARQREIALGKRVVNTQGRESIALADSKHRAAVMDDDGNWMA